jgi:hypothetical protein
VLFFANVPITFQMNVAGLILAAAALLGALSFGHTGRTKRDLTRLEAEQVYADLQNLMTGPLKTAVPIFCTAKHLLPFGQISMRFYVEDKNVVQEVYLSGNLARLANNLLKLQNVCDKEKPLYWSPKNRCNDLKRIFFVEPNIEDWSS